MKHVYAQRCLASVLLAAIAVPVVGDRSKLVDQNPTRTVQMPTVPAEAFPMANSWPTPWPKKQVSVKVAEPSGVQVANGFPTPWPKKPGGTLS